MASATSWDYANVTLISKKIVPIVVYANFFLIGCPCGDRPGIYRHAKEKKMSHFHKIFFLFGPKSQCIYLDNKLLAFLIFWYIRFLPGWFAAESKCTVHVALPKRPIN